MEWGSVGTAATSGALVALFAALLGYLVSRLAAKRITERWDLVRSARERNLAATAEFYGAYGEFFAALKIWGSFVRLDHEEGIAASSSERLTCLGKVVEAEGLLESFLFRLTHEFELRTEDVERMWCFRSGYKQLRYAARENRPLQWRRNSFDDDPVRHEGYRAYRAFKGLSVDMANLLATRSDHPHDRPDYQVVLRQLTEVTGPGREIESRHAETLTAERHRREALGLGGATSEWAWYVIYEELAAESPRRRGFLSGTRTAR
jgi:hypothetical protein